MSVSEPITIPASHTPGSGVLGTDGESGVTATPIASGIRTQHNPGTNETSGSVSGQTDTDQPEVSSEQNNMATGDTNEAAAVSESESGQSSSEEEEEGEGQGGGGATSQPGSQRNAVSVSEPVFPAAQLPNLAQQALQRLANAHRYSVLASFPVPPLQLVHYLLYE